MEFSKTQTKVQIEEKMIVCIPVAGYQNNPLSIQRLFTEAGDALKLHHIVHCSLDTVDEKGVRCGSGGSAVEAF
ncbi:putative trafficking protein particle complex subunit 2 [Helianthus annuus]|uniref:Uncharacterized protein n=1 Tax=Helianthus annuus TaxID=4232 RepID=A0A251UQU5_HELAN|nr:putative trafficking protein particle complex subunit 2 [Helianthus annuus]KAJ0585031.1 putative trafficking protein particle complex subunit 2 [Helianthus annuus]KAJ0747592.1 putative trafficking protein particle complex subunit 2 [Helianthus annuus]KAJ0919473.1 putative trafficking protein particle complex subunit 2 [Helianthus annuus]